MFEKEKNPPAARHSVHRGRGADARNAMFQVFVEEHLRFSKFNVHFWPDKCEPATKLNFLSQFAAIELDVDDAVRRQMKNTSRVISCGSRPKGRELNGEPSD